ncbi:MAG TPA: 50S ribosomal protein L21 [Ferruginibacter sp.]|nr:50S ribosomal protein L21 [Ferruginibacter sp.]
MQHWVKKDSKRALKITELPYLCRPKFRNVMLAIVKIAGQQFKVKAGDSLYVPHLSGKAGDSVEFSDVLLTSSGSSVTTSAGTKVKAEILSDLVKGEKVIAFKMKRRKGFRKKHGHRTQYTHIKITAIA